MSAILLFALTWSADVDSWRMMDYGAAEYVRPHHMHKFPMRFEADGNETFAYRYRTWLENSAWMYPGLAGQARHKALVDDAMFRWRCWFHLSAAHKNFQEFFRPAWAPPRFVPEPDDPNGYYSSQPYVEWQNVEACYIAHMKNLRELLDAEYGPGAYDLGVMPDPAPFHLFREVP